MDYAYDDRAQICRDRSNDAKRILVWNWSGILWSPITDFPFRTSIEFGLYGHAICKLMRKLFLPIPVLESVYRKNGVIVTRHNDNKKNTYLENILLIKIWHNINSTSVHFRTFWLLKRWLHTHLNHAFTLIFYFIYIILYLTFANIIFGLRACIKNQLTILFKKYNINLYFAVWTPIQLDGVRSEYDAWLLLLGLSGDHTTRWYAGRNIWRTSRGRLVNGH